VAADLASSVGIGVCDSGVPVGDTNFSLLIAMIIRYGCNRNPLPPDRARVVLIYSLRLLSSI